MAVNNQNNRLDLSVIRLLSEKCERKANVLSLEANLFYAAGLPHLRFDLYAAEIWKDLAGYLHAHGKNGGIVSGYMYHFWEIYRVIELPQRSLWFGFMVIIRQKACILPDLSLNNDIIISKLRLFVGFLCFAQF